MKRENINILLVDDEEMIVNQLSFYLENCEYEIEGTSDPEEATRLIKNNHYHMVITDLRMPKVSGMDLVKQVKDSSQNTLVLIITGYADTDSAIEAIQHGVYDFIRKPFEFKEIKGKVDRAADRIIMESENRELNEKIKKMLNYVTTIFDISSILYQVSDFKTIINMILDTITEGLKIKKVGLLLKEQYKDTYTIYKSRNLPLEISKNLEIAPSSTINGITLKDHEPTIIDTLDDTLIINDQNYQIRNEVSSCLFTPISFRDKIFGYLLVFDVNTRLLSTDDELKLLKILATQIAPLFLSQDLSGEKNDKNIRNIEYILKDIIEKSMKKAEQKSANIYFLQMKAIFKNNISIQDDYEIFQKKLVNIIKREVPKSSEILRQGLGSFFITIYNSTPVEAEHICANIRTKIEDLYTSEKNEPLLSLKYALVDFPRDGRNFLEIMSQMEHKFYSSSTGLYLKNHEIVN